MLGEKIGEISGKVTMQRVLPNLGGDPKMETSFQATGSVLGTNIKDTGTYTDHFPSGRDTIWRRSRHDDNEGRQNGHLDRPWCWHNEKRRNRDLSRRALFPNYAPKWSRLNKVAVLFEYAVDAEGNTHSEYWEWK